MNPQEAYHIELGKTPILIFSNRSEDASYFSLLVSNHLLSKNYSIPRDRNLSADDHYFINASVHQCVLKSLKEPEPKGITQQLLLLLDEGFDTQKLWGLSLPTELFPLLQLDMFPKETLFIFLYNEFEPLDAASEIAVQSIQSFDTENLKRHLVLNSKFLISQPHEILKLLQLILDVEIIKSSTIIPLAKSYLDEKNELSYKQSEYDWLKANDSMLKHHAWMLSRNITVIFPNVNEANLNIFIDRYVDLQLSVLTPATCILICDSEQTIISIKNKLKNTDCLVGEISYEVRSSQSIHNINSWVEKMESTFILFDLLVLNFSYASLFNSHSIAFANIELTNEERTINLSDLLVKDIVLGNLFVERSIFLSLNGFDSTLNEDYIYWDFCIRNCDINKKNINIIPSAYIAQDNKDMDTMYSHQDELGYTQVLKKHTSLLEASLNELLELSSKQSYRTIKENQLLNSKIASLQLISSHAKDELKSLQQLTTQLHQRIQYLENNWYQKLRIKLNRIKKIFFKQKSPGTGTLKRILQFIRFSFSKAGFGIVRKVIANILKRLYLKFEKRPVEIVYTDIQGNYGIYTYDDWVHEKINPEKIQSEYELETGKFDSNPLISIIMPVYNTPARYLKEAIESVMKQVYTNWELCIADDCSTDSKVRKMLRVYAAKDKRIKVYFRTENGHISATSNDALRMATGEFVMLMDHDDLIPTNCIWEFVKSIHQNPKADIFYSDEDKIDELKRHKDAHFKPDWAPDHLLSRNYLGHMTMLRKTLMDEIGGFRIGFEGSQDYDLMLRATERTQHIIHIPKVLYHWRIHQLSAAQGEDVKPYAYIAAKKALEEALVRRNLKGDVKYLSGLRGYRIDYELQENDLVTIIIPTKDQTELLKNTIDSIFEITSYRNFEIIVLNNNSVSDAFDNWRKEASSKFGKQLQIVDAHFPFNFSKLMNIGAELAQGNHLLLLNNDVEIIHADWLTSMLAYTQQKRIGAVGAKLLYPDDTVQHAGVIVGLGGIAGHVFVGAYKDEAGYFNYIQSVNNFSAVTAACLLIRKDVFLEVGGMDESFEVEYNDVDFCLKVMKAGYNNVYLPQVELYHYESATRGHPHQSKVSYERHLREMKLFKDKWQDIIDHDPHYNPNLNLGVHDFSMNFSA